MTLIIDGQDMVLGRLASYTAAIILEKKDEMEVNTPQGKKSIRPAEHDKVFIINADKVVISGDPNGITQRYLDRIHKKTNTNPRRGPFMPRTPETIVKRAIRGMVPHRQHKGKVALKKLKVFVGKPSDLPEGETIYFDSASAKKFTCPRITVGELGRRIGSYRNRVPYVKS